MKQTSSQTISYFTQHHLKLWFVMLAIVLLSGSLTACDNHVSAKVEISNPTLSDAPPTAAMRAGYATITNHHDYDVTLTGIDSMQFASSEIHTMEHENGMMKMRELEQLLIPAGESVTLEPGGMHVMFMNSIMYVGNRAVANLTFTHADGQQSKQTVEFVQPQ